MAGGTCSATDSLYRSKSLTFPWSVFLTLKNILRCYASRNSLLKKRRTRVSHWCENAGVTGIFYSSLFAYVLFCEPP